MLQTKQNRRFVIATLVVFAASLSIGACGHHRHRSKQFSIKEANEKLEIFFDHIDATEDQKQRIRNTAKKLLVKVQSQRASHKQAKALMLAEWNKSQPDKQALHKLVDKRAAELKTMAHSVVDAVGELHGTLTPKQRAKLARIFQRHMAH